jgi:hypothetical protein
MPTLALLSCAQQPTKEPTQAVAEVDAAQLQMTMDAIALRHGLDPEHYQLDGAPLDRDMNPRGLSLLADDLRYGAAPTDARRRWHIDDDAPTQIFGTPRLAGYDDIKNFFDSLAPLHLEYALLEAALEATPREDAATRRMLKINMERWRWMPQDLGTDYVLVNAPSFEALIVKDGAVVARHRAIVGAQKTPTPQFNALATGVAVRPTWFVPSSIVRESVGALLESDPLRAERLGYYVAADGSIRQRPGPANALGEMKLIMPNRFSVFLHDTSARERFKDENRALSHGCIRIDKAGDFAKTLLANDADRAEYDRLIATGKTAVIDFDEPLPVYITYFTAFSDSAGDVAFHRDIYDLDSLIMPEVDTRSAEPGELLKHEECQSTE